MMVQLAILLLCPLATAQNQLVEDDSVTCNPACFDAEFTCESCCSTGLSASGSECFRGRNIFPSLDPTEIFEACCTGGSAFVEDERRLEGEGSYEDGSYGEPSEDGCIFPFTYNGIVYNSCTIENNNNVPWCYTVKDAVDGSPWKNCPTTSPTKSPTEEPSKSPTREPTKEPTKSPTPNPTTAPTLYVFGEISFILDLSSETVESFTDEKKAKVAAAIADTMDVDVQYIEVTVKEAARRLSERRLASGIQLDVTVKAASQETYLNIAAGISDSVGFSQDLVTALDTQGIVIAMDEFEVNANIGSSDFGAAPVMRRKAPAVAHFRFEDTMPSAYYRHENVYTDHSGNNHHLAFFETVGTAGTADMKYDNVLDAIPQNVNCTSNVGASCTSLRWDDPNYVHSDNSDHYFVDKRERDNWVSYSGSFITSTDVPPIAMFNIPAAPQPFQTTFRHDLYTVTTHSMPGGAGKRSLDAESMTENSRAWILTYNASVASIANDRYTTETTSALSFTGDFTLEGFFKTSTNDEQMTILMQEKDAWTADAADTFAYTVDINHGSDAGALRFAIAGEISGTKTIREVKIDNRNYADGNWHYFVARHNVEAYGNANSMGKIELKTYSDDGELTLMGVKRPQLSFGLTSVEPEFQIYSGKGNMHLGGTGMYQSNLRQKFKGKLDEVRFNHGLVNDEDLLGLVAADYVQMPTVPTCTGQTVLKERIGSFNDGTNSSTEYPNNLACSWMIDHSELNTGYQHDMFIAITFTRFSTEPNMDTVTVYDGETTSSPVLGVFSGYDMPTVSKDHPDSAHIPLVSSSTKVLIVFSTDGQQRGPQLGWDLKYASISMAQRECNTVAEGHTLSLACPAGHIISKVNFASYGAGQTGYCSNAAGPPMATAQSDVGGFVLQGNDNSNIKSSIMDYTEADEVMVNEHNRPGGAGNQLAGPVLFRTGYCHAANSRTIVEDACRGQASCTIDATNAVFASGSDPCSGISDSRLGSEGDGDDADVAGTDSYPRHDIPYASPISKRLFVQVTCEATMAFASNCFNECAGQGTCLYGLKAPHCSWCPKLGLVRNTEGVYDGHGCGKAYCVKNAQCGTKISMGA